MLRRHCVLQVVLLTILIILCIVLGNTYDSRVKHRVVERALARSIASISAEIQDAHDHETKLNNNFSVWREMSDTHVYSRDDKSSGNLQSIIQNLCEKHKVIVKELVISDPRDLSGDYKKRYTKVVRHVVRMQFEALTDQHAVMLVHAIKYDIPGFIAVRLLEMTKEKEITQEVIASSDRGVILPTVKGEIVLDIYGIYGTHL
ncbi:hypothetical protein ACIS_01069 [Anaplasma centrale str. Israel]|uniref:Uncharacterized protein n=1 Tax=Anaplasma centrale (strain Israel) TaxID=574556 RepID=D1ASU3_ANACI|nr:hypothetical protein [Anaplasma centrale]ACZ49546.1 hypothetical protein ACIS_01069 [Anaplasma centrale str. Israel]